MRVRVWASVLLPILFISASAGLLLGAEKPPAWVPPQGREWMAFCRGALGSVLGRKYADGERAFDDSVSYRRWKLRYNAATGEAISAVKARAKLAANEIRAHLDRGRLEAAEEERIEGLSIDTRQVFIRVEVAAIKILNSLLKLKFISDQIAADEAKSERKLPERVKKLRELAAAEWKASERWHADYASSYYYYRDIRNLLETRITKAKARAKPTAAAPAPLPEPVAGSANALAAAQADTGKMERIMLARLGIADPIARSAWFDDEAPFRAELGKIGFSAEELKDLRLIDWDEVSRADRGEDIEGEKAKEHSQYLDLELLKSLSFIPEVQVQIQKHGFQVERRRVRIVALGRPWIRSLFFEAVRRIPVYGKTLSESALMQRATLSETNWRVYNDHFPELAMLISDEGSIRQKLKDLMELAAPGEDPEILKTLCRRNDYEGFLSRIEAELELALAEAGASPLYAAFKDELTKAKAAAVALGPISQNYEPRPLPLLLDIAGTLGVLYGVHAMGWDASLISVVTGVGR